MCAQKILDVQSNNGEKGKIDKFSMLAPFLCDKRKCYKQRWYEQNRAEGEPIQYNKSWRRKATPQ